MNKRYFLKKEQIEKSFTRFNNNLRKCPKIFPITNGVKKRVLKILTLQNTLTTAILLVLLGFLVIIPLIPEVDENGSTNNSVTSGESLEEKSQSKQIDPFDALDLESRSAIVWDIKNQKALFEKNSDEIAPLASITKILTATLSYDLLPPNTEIRIEKEFLQAEGDSGLLANESWRLKDLIDFTLMTSSNDGARAIASVAGSFLIGTPNFEIGREEFIRKMNQKAFDIGLSDILIRDETGLDKNESQSGSYGTAKDVALLFQYVLENSPEIFESTKRSKREFTSLTRINHTASNTNSIIDEIPGIIGSKTGFTDLAGGNLGIIFDPSLGRPLVTVVLGSTYDGRFVDTKKLVEAARKYIIQEKTANYDN